MNAPTTVIFLGLPERWLTKSEAEIVDRGEHPHAPVEGSRIVAVVPASDVVVHQLALPDLTDAQARAAARLAVAENSVSPITTLHVAVSADREGERTVVVIAAARMADYLADLVTRGIDPDAVIASPLILNRPEIGFVVADLGSETVIRARDGAFLDDPALTPLLTGGEMATLDAEALDAAIVAAASAPEVDLRQGIFARRRQWAIDPVRLRRIGLLAVACLASLLILPVAELIRTNAAADKIEARNREIAQAALPAGTVVTDPLAQMNERLAEVGGGGGSFLSLSNAVASAAKASASLELGPLTFDGTTGLNVNAHATGPGDLALFETQMASAGLLAVPVTSAAIGANSCDFTVRAR